MTGTPPHRPPAGRARLYRMPAERALAAIPAGSISIVITDPPYTSVNRQGGTGAHLQHWFRGRWPCLRAPAPSWRSLPRSPSALPP